MEKTRGPSVRWRSIYVLPSFEHGLEVMGMI
jgi:hypothetical protein